MRRQIKKNIGKMNPAAEFGVYVIRPTTSVNSRPTWLFYTLGFKQAEEFGDFFSRDKVRNLVIGICKNDEG
jgi:hypothetical protein